MNKQPRIRFEHKLTASYIMLGLLWILFSDNLLGLLVSDKESFNRFQTYKGWFYVLMTGAFFFFFLKRHLTQLREVEQKAIESDKLKSSFLANVSHEIRTPMNGILGFAQLLQNPSFTAEEQQEYIKMIGKSSERLLILINDLVTISNIEAGTISLFNTKIDLPKMLSFLCSVYRPTAQIKGIELFERFESKSGERIVCLDKEKILSILSHLLKNAIKFSSSGIIEIGCVVEDTSATFFVSDTGIGIPERSLNNIFERFSQGSNNISRGYEGIGLGLSISKNFIEIMGGTISVESVENKFTKFCVSIPLNNSLDSCAEGDPSDFSSFFEM